MNVLSSVLYLLLCAAGSAALTRSRVARSNHEDIVATCLAWTTLFSAAFFVGFHLLGYINLLTDLPVVDPFYAAVVALLAFVGIGLWLRRRVPGLVDSGGKAKGSRPFVNQLSLPGSRLGRALAIATVTVFALIALMLSAGFPRGYEANSYHLPIAAHMFQAHSLKVWTAGYTELLHTIPANASIYFGFLLGLMPEHLVAAANLVFLVPLAAAAYGIARAIGADETASLLSALGLVTIPLVVAPATDAVADIGGLAFLATAVYFVLSRPTGRPWDLVLSGLAAGMAFGFKNLHLVGTFFLFLVILVQTWHSSPSDVIFERLRSTIRSLSIFLAFTFVTSSFWLVRNTSKWAIRFIRCTCRFSICSAGRQEACQTTATWSPIGCARKPSGSSIRG